MKYVAQEAAPSTSATGESDGDVLSLLRYAHIFSSVVREVLEIELLREVSPEPISLSQFHLLKLISLNGHHQVGEVADFLGVSAPAATKNIDKLERLGLVVRRPSVGDRRATLLGSSPRGRRLVKRYEALKADRLAPVVDSFDEGELRVLADLLERFSVALLEAEHTETGICLRCSAYYEESCPIPHAQDNCPYKRARDLRRSDSRRDRERRAG